MTDKERLIELFAAFGIEIHVQNVADGSSVIETYGYNRNTIEFNFDRGGKFIGIGAYEGIPWGY